MKLELLKVFQYPESRAGERNSYVLQIRITRGFLWWRHSEELYVGYLGLKWCDLVTCIPLDHGAEDACGDQYELWWTARQVETRRLLFKLPKLELLWEKPAPEPDDTIEPGARTVRTGPHR